MGMGLDQFVKLLSKSGVMTKEEITAFLQSQPADKTPQNGSELAVALVKQGRLTRYQAQRIGNGQGQGLVFGEYVILDEIGAGGMGQVFKARHRRMKREVAVKFLPAKALNAPGARERFQREVEAAAKLSHPNIVMAYDAGEHAGQHFLVMEYVAGSDLSSHLKRQGLLPVDLVLDYTIQAARGLEYAHKAGVIHRDIKPSNLLLDTNGTVKILDMGLARIEADSAREELTATGQVMGTVHYMPPEQARSVKSADHRADIYSLGCTLYTLLTGEPTYNGETVVEILMAHQNQPIPSLRAARPDIPERLDTAMQKLLAKSPEDRFQSMTEVIRELNACRQEPPSGLESTVGTGSSSISAPGSASTGTLPQTGQKVSVDTLTGTLEATQGWQPQPDTAQPRPAYKRRKRSPLTLIAGGAVSLLLILVATLYLSGIIFQVETPAGTIILEVEDPSAIGATVTVDGQRKITIQTADSPTPIEVTADEKKHTLKVSKEGFETFTKEFSLKSGGKETIRVRLQPPKVAATLPGPGKPLAFTQPGFDAWVQGVRKLPVEEQVQAVAKKLQELNPGFDGKIDYRVLNGLHEATLTADHIQDLSPLAGFAKLGCLFCSGSSKDQGQLKDLSPLRGMKLTQAEFNFNPHLSDLSPLEGMPVKSLGIAYTSVADLKVPGSFSELVYLNARVTRITSLEPLANCRQLRILSINATPVKDLSPLKGLPLKALYCEDSSVKDLSPLSGMPLETLDLRGAAVDDLSSLQQMPLKILYFHPARIRQGMEILREMTTLQTLALEWEKSHYSPEEFWKKYDAGEFAALAFQRPGFEEWVKQVQALPAEEQVKAVAKKLQELNPGFDGKVEHQIAKGQVTNLSFSGSLIKDLSPVRALPGLLRLYCPSSSEQVSPLSDLAPLQGVRLTEFNCNHSSVSDLSPLRGMPLKYLDCFATPVSDLAPLAGMPLEKLYITVTAVSDLSPLRGMPLSLLYADKTRIADLSPLKGLPLTNLGIEATRITDLSPLKGMQLVRLAAYRAAFSDLSPLQGMPLELLVVSGTPVTDLSPLKGMPLKSLSFSPRTVKQGIEVIREMNGLQSIGTSWTAESYLPPEEFWKKYDAGEFGQPEAE